MKYLLIFIIAYMLGRFSFIEKVIDELLRLNRKTFIYQWYCFIRCFQRNITLKFCKELHCIGYLSNWHLKVLTKYKSRGKE